MTSDDISPAAQEGRDEQRSRAQPLPRPLEVGRTDGAEFLSQADHTAVIGFEPGALTVEEAQSTNGIRRGNFASRL